MEVDSTMKLTLTLGVEYIPKEIKRLIGNKISKKRFIE